MDRPRPLLVGTLMISAVVLGFVVWASVPMLFNHYSVHIHISRPQLIEEPSVFELEDFDQNQDNKVYPQADNVSMDVNKINDGDTSWLESNEDFNTFGDNSLDRFDGILDFSDASKLIYMHETQNIVKGTATLNPRLFEIDIRRYRHGRVKSQLFHPRHISKNDLAALGVIREVALSRNQTFLSVFEVEVPADDNMVYNSPFKANSSSIRRFQAGESFIHWKDNEITKDVDGMLMLRIGKTEYTPLLKRTAFRHIELEWAFDEFVYMYYRNCDTFRAEMKTCIQSSWIIEYLRRLMKENNLLVIEPEAELSKTIPASALSKLKKIAHHVNTKFTFEQKMDVLFPKLGEADLCRSSRNLWHTCTLYTFCSWAFIPSMDTHKCLHSSSPYLLPMRHFAGDSNTTQGEAVYDHGLEFNFSASEASDTLKYLLYQPSGGFNNQRIQLEVALATCIMLDRTCILPHFAGHTNYYFRYNMFKPSDLVSAQYIFNMEKLLEAVKVVTIPREMTLLQFIDKLGGTQALQGPAMRASAQSPVGTKWKIINRDRDTFQAQHRWTSIELKKYFKKEKAKYLVFSNFTMWGAIDLGVYNAEKRTINYKLLYTNQLKRWAMAISSSIGVYNAIHVRRGDKTRERKFYEDGEAGQKASWYASKFPGKITKKMYVATDAKNISWFDPIKDAGLEIVRWTDVDQVLIQPLYDHFPQAFFFTALGIVEQLVCSYSAAFLGSYYSTFTLYILRMRKLLDFLGPDTSDPEAMLALPSIQFNSKRKFKYPCYPNKPETHVFPC